MARVVSAIPSSVFTTRASCLTRGLVTRRDEDDDDVHRAIALAKASYRSVLRATLGLRDDDDGRGTESTTTTTTMTKIAPLSARARGVLVDRVATLARDDARRLGDKANNATLTLTSASRLAALREFTSKCVIATAFFRRAHRNPGSEEAAHARVAVGYLDGARRRERRLSPDGGGGASKKSKLLGGIRGEAQRAWSGVLQNECAAFTGFTSSLIPSDSDFHSD